MITVVINVLLTAIISQVELQAILPAVSTSVKLIDTCKASGDYRATASLTPYMQVITPSGEIIYDIYGFKYAKERPDFMVIFRETGSLGSFSWLYLEELTKRGFLRVVHCEVNFGIDVSSDRFHTAVEACLAEYLQGFVYHGVNVEEFDGVLRRKPFYFMGQFLDFNHIRVDVVKNVTQSATIPIKNYAKLKLEDYGDYLRHIEKPAVNAACEYSLII